MPLRYLILFFFTLLSCQKKLQKAKNSSQIISIQKSENQSDKNNFPQNNINKGIKVKTIAGNIKVITLNPKIGDFFLLSSADPERNQTGQEWLKNIQKTKGPAIKRIVLSNAGMFDVDYITHVGYLKFGNTINNSTWNPKYKSVFLANPKNKNNNLPKAQIIDTDGSKPELAEHYNLVIQNLRLIGNSENKWTKQNKIWSEAALGMDKKGILYFFFSKDPMSMYDFNEHILNSELQIIRAMHLEGGPEASLSIKNNTDNFEMHLNGSYETGFNENHLIEKQWPIPLILGFTEK